MPPAKEAPAPEEPAGADETAQPAGDAEPVPDPLEELRCEAADLKARLRAVSAAYQRLQEDMAAYKEREERTRQARLDGLRGDAVALLFQPLEDLRRSVEELRKAGLDGSLLDGIELVQRSFFDAFEKLGLEEVPGLGSTFSPDHHEAMNIMPVTDPELDGKVVEVFETGYHVRHRLIRPARVVIGRYQEPAGEA